MKKSIIIGTLLALFLVGLVIAIPMPLPFAGEVRIQGMPPPTGADITVKSMTYGTVMATKVDANGHFQINLANYGLSSGWYEVAVVSCSDNPHCIQIVFVQDDPVKLIFDINPVVIPTDTINTIYSYICWDNSKVADVSQCPTPLPGMKTCEDGSEVPENEDCPEKTTQHWLLIVIETLAAILAGGVGWRFISGKFYHWHRGIKSYHDPNTRHNNPKYRHTRWNDGAWKCIKEATLIQNGTDMVEYREEQEAKEDE